MKRQFKNRRGFTLIELLIVIALIALLITVLVPVMVGFLKGKGLSMAGNNISGFLAFGRGEAMNWRLPHVVVFHEEEVSVGTGTVVEIEEYAGPGLAIYRINPLDEDRTNVNEDGITFVRKLDFADSIGGSVDFADEWKQNAARGPMPDVPDAANTRFRDEYKILIRPDGRLMIPEDKPGYVIDKEEPTILNTDLTLTDGSRFVFLDFNSTTGAVKRSLIYDAEELGK